MKRREFLRQSVLAAAAFSVPSLGMQVASQDRLERKGAVKKVIVMGAGLAGLSAAYELTQAGHDVILLEARTRPGGRVYTLREPFSDGMYAEAGARMIPDTNDITLKYVSLFRLPLDPARPPNLRTVFHLRGKRITPARGENPDWPLDLTPEEKRLGIDGMWAKYEPESIYQEIGDTAASGWPFDSLKKYDRMSYADFLRGQGASSEALALLTLDAAHWGDGLDTVSALVVLRDTAQYRKAKNWYRIRGGNDLLPKAFAARLKEKILYGSPVVRIEHNERGVRIIFEQAGAHQTISGDYLVCAVPFSVLRQIEVAPRFSPAKQKVIEQLRYFSAARVSLQSRKKFWVDQGFDGTARTDLPISEAFDMTCNQPGPRGVLQCYAGGPQARQITAMKESERVSFVLEQMEQLHPGIRENFEGGISKCWDEDEWARGASSWYKPGGMTELWPHVAQREGRVHFAGDHSSPWIRWMQGALYSGNRAAREVNEAL